MNNGKQMMIAWRTYSGDFSGLVAPNEDTSAIDACVWVRGHAINLPDATNTLLLTDSRNNVLADYIGKNTKIFKCPADPANSHGGGTKLPTIRSFAMNQAVAQYAPISGTERLLPMDARLLQRMGRGWMEITVIERDRARPSAPLERRVIS